MARTAPLSRVLCLGTAALTLAGCEVDLRSLDFDLRDAGGQFDTSEAVRQATADRPQPDSRGVISYPNYQVAVASRGDTVEDVAARVGLPADEIARFNGLPTGVRLRPGEIIALPSRVAEPSPATGAIETGPIRPAGEVDVATIAGSAIERAGPDAPARQTGLEPVRHKVTAGETAFSVARLYNVEVSDLAEWNGLGSDLTIREGQFLLIPVAVETAALPAPDTAAPGRGSVAPEPPSAATPLPAEDAKPEPAATPAQPDLADDATDASDTGRLRMPVAGNIIRNFEKDKNEGIGIAAAAGTPVAAADDGTVAAITRNTDQVPILVLRHAGNLLTVYANIDGITVAKGDTVSRGQTVATIRNGSPSFLHFEVREGFDSVDPLPYLQ